MDTAEVRERVPEDLLERIRLLTTQAELIDRDVEALARTFAEIDRDWDAQADCCVEDDDRDAHFALTGASGFDRLRMTVGAIAARAVQAVGGTYYRGMLRDAGFDGYGIDPPCVCPDNDRLAVCLVHGTDQNSGAQNYAPAGEVDA